MSPRSMWPVVLALAAACSADRPPAAPEPAPALDLTRPPPALPPLTLERTAALVTRADLAAAVDALAEEPVITPPVIGPSAEPSEIWARWETVRKAATPDEIVALLRHESRVVRGYAADHVVDALPDRAEALRPLFGDSTDLTTVSGDKESLEHVSSYVVRMICEAAHRPANVQALLVDVARTPGPVADQAFDCAVRWGFPAALDLARAWLADRASPGHRTAALRALSRLAPRWSCGRYAQLVDDPDPGVRDAARALLASCPGGGKPASKR